ncbi:MAG: dihydroorotate dehydrogenase electron transfer subunit [Candidatus Marinimicrobia bacterium]|nr:dihydroorotate dehydrogenase electron transfer subunit [Candidatus Neomarinimicrobiota bacterium]
MRVLSNEKIALNIYSLTFESTSELLESLPGQFVNINVRGEDSPFFRRPFSIASATDDCIEIIFEVVGAGTWQLSTLHVGDSVDVIGPLGLGYDLDFTESKSLLIGGGVGLPPLMFLYYKMKNKGIEPQFLAGFKSVSYNFMPRNITNVHFSSDDGSLGSKGYVTDLLIETLFHEKVDHIYACGPEPMLSKVIEIAEENEIRCSVSIEKVFGCGTGICFGCIIENSLKRLTETGRKYSLACVEGTVFDAGDINL